MQRASGNTLSGIRTLSKHTAKGSGELAFQPLTQKNIDKITSEKLNRAWRILEQKRKTRMIRQVQQGAKNKRIDIDANQMSLMQRLLDGGVITGIQPNLHDSRNPNIMNIQEQRDSIQKLNSYKPYSRPSVQPQPSKSKKSPIRPKKTVLTYDPYKTIAMDREITSRFKFNQTGELNLPKINVGENSAPAPEDRRARMAPISSSINLSLPPSKDSQVALMMLGSLNQVMIEKRARLAQPSSAFKNPTQAKLIQMRRRWRETEGKLFRTKHFQADDDEFEDSQVEPSDSFIQHYLQ